MCASDWPLVERQTRLVMFISVIVATRNRPDLLKRALASVQSQTYPTFEVLVIDDGSEASTRTAYSHLRAELKLDDRFRFFQVGTDGQRGQGPSASRNLGIRLSKGSILAFCDDDDLWVESAHLAAVAQLFENHLEVDLCISNQRAVYADGTVREQWLSGLFFPTQKMLTERFVWVSVNQLCNSQGFAHLNMCCIRRTAIEAIGGFWEAVNYEEDRDFFWRAVDKAKGIAYSATTVAQHHVPDPALRLTVSSAMKQQERWLVAALVCRHIAVTVQTQAIAQLSLRYEGDLLRRLALRCEESGQFKACSRLANQALGTRFSVKWALYCLWIWLKAVIR